VFLLRFCSWSYSSVVLVQPTVLHNCVRCTVPLCTAGRSYSGGGEHLSPSTLFQGPILPEEFSFSQYHFYTAGHHPAGGSRLPPGPTISQSLFLRLLGLSAAKLDHTPFPPSCDQHSCGIILEDLLILLYELHHSWIGLSLRRFVAGGRLSQL
jgi:hypothetical protein